MNFDIKHVPPLFLPYSTLQPAERMFEKYFKQNPILPIFPNIDSCDSIFKRSVMNLAGIEVVNGKIKKFDYENKDVKKSFIVLDKAFETGNINELQNFCFESSYFRNFLDFIEKNKSKIAYINLVGPFTFALLLCKMENFELFENKVFRKFIVQSISVKAMWAIKKIKEVSLETTPVIILDEPLLKNLGELKNKVEEINSELIIALTSMIVEKIHAENAKVMYQSFEKCDWKIPVDSGVDIISFNADNYLDNLVIFKDKIKEFLQKGGQLNWAVVSGITEASIKGYSVDYLVKKMNFAFSQLIDAGISPKLVYNSATISINGDLSKLPIVIAEKAIILTSQIVQKIPQVD